MRNLFPKITAILLGAVFLLGGATTAFGAEFFYYKENSGGGSAPVQVGGPFADKPSCQTAQQAKEKETTTFGSPKYRTTTFCHAGTSLAEEQAKATAQTAANSAQQVAANNATGENLTEEQKQERALLSRLHCGISITEAGEDNLVDCIPKFVYYAIYKPSSYLLSGSGYILDVMLTLSIDSQFVNQTFVADSWTVVRDFSNMLFIFILLYVGVQTILGMGDWRKTVLMVIVMALLINFSLFFTKVVIDAGNVLAVGIYSSMSTPKSPDKQNIISGGVPERSISGSMAGAFAPQKFLKVSGDVMALDATIVFIIATIVSLFAAYVFFKAALVFVGRLIAFWFLMIVSPFAFISLALPGKANKFQGWVDLLLAQAFVAPVFLFMVYMIMKVISSGNGILEGMIKQPTATASFTFDKVLAPVIVATLIIIALQKALEYAESMAGDFGKLGSGIMGSMMGIAAGAATGGAAFVGRNVVGGYAAHKLASGELEEGSAKYRAAQLATRASFDVRNLAGEKSIFGKTVGGAISKGGGALGVNVGKGSGVGGVEKMAKDAQKSATDNVPAMGVFEEQGARSRAAKTAELQKGQLEATQKTITEKTTVVKAANDKLESAQKEEREFMMNNNTGAQLDPRIALKLAEAKKEKADAEAALTKATEQETAIKTTQKETDVEAVIKKENEKRRLKYADKVKESGDHTSAAKIRKGEESGHAKKLKELAEKKKKAEKEGKSTDYISAIDDQIKEAKGDVKKEEEMKK